jgi:1-acyl-sn-glycerol-3-phosphate acyltransferase
MRRLRSLAFDALWGLWTGLFAFAIPVFWALGNPAASIRRATRLWARGTMFLLAEVVGLRHSVRRATGEFAGPQLIVANHQSTWETVAALVLFPDVAIVTKRELLRIPIMGWYLRRSPMIIIDREEAAKALREMIELSRQAIAEGRSVMIFPEGTRIAVGQPVRFKRGVELLYRSLGAPLRPVAHNSGRFWPRGSTPKSPGEITISFLPPIPPGLRATDAVQAAEAAIGAETSALG